MNTESRRFQLVRDVDISGVSGTGVVADGVVFPDGHAAIHWRGEWPTTTPHPSMESVLAVHGHGGATRVVWLDITEPPHGDYASAWTELRGYVEHAVHDGGGIDPADMLRYLDELKRRALSPVEDWMRTMLAKAEPEGSPLEPVDKSGEVSP